MREGGVYGIQAGAYYKIGWTANLPQRLSHAKVRGKWLKLTADEVLALKALTANAFEEGCAEAPSRDKILPEKALGHLLPTHGVATLTDLARGLGLRKQCAWLLWHSEVALSLDPLRRIHETFGAPVEVLLRVTRATPPKRLGRKPREGRPSTPSKEEA